MISSATSLDPSIINRTLELARSIQQIPAPPFGESRRAAFIYEAFVNENLCNATVDEVGNVLACIPGDPDRLPVIVSAHMDTVFPSGTPLTYELQPGRVSAPGIGDNSLGVASLFGLLWSLRFASNGRQLPANVWLVANVGEEGLGNLRGMRALVSKFKGDVLAYVVIEGMAYGKVFHRALEIQRYKITVKTPGGHSWLDFGKPSAINEIAKLITELADLPIPHKPQTSLNIGTISGGTSINTIAAEASLELDLRSESSRILNRLAREIESNVLNAAREQVEISMEQIGHRPGGEIPANHPLVQLACRCLRLHGMQPALSIGSTDANIPLSLGLPAVCVGVTRGAGAHTMNEYIETEFLPQGLGQMVDLVQSILHHL